MTVELTSHTVRYPPYGYAGFDVPPVSPTLTADNACAVKLIDDVIQDLPRNDGDDKSRWN